MASSVNLGKKLEETIDKFVSEGRYGSRSEVLREGVRLVEEREKRLEKLDAALREGLADAEAGRTTPLDGAFDQLEAYVQTLIDKKAA